jgi:hypothetical protein
LSLNEFDVESFKSFLSFLSHSAVQDLTLGSLVPEQLPLLAEVLPSVPLQSLELNVRTFGTSQHDSAYVALFSALERSSLRNFTLLYPRCRLATLEACLNKIPLTPLTRFHLALPTIFCSDTNHLRQNDTEVDLRTILFDWNSRFPLIKDRFCLMTYTQFYDGSVFSTAPPRL